MVIKNLLGRGWTRVFKNNYIPRSFWKDIKLNDFTFTAILHVKDKKIFLQFLWNEVIEYGLLAKLNDSIEMINKEMELINPNGKNYKLIYFELVKKQKINVSLKAVIWIDPQKRYDSNKIFTKKLNLICQRLSRGLEIIKNECL